MSAFEKASQCDIPLAVPLLARRKRTVFAGDSRQRRHVGTLDTMFDQTLVDQPGITAAQVQRFRYLLSRP